MSVEMAFAAAPLVRQRFSSSRGGDGHSVEAPFCCRVLKELDSLLLICETLELCCNSGDRISEFIQWQWKFHFQKPLEVP
jgi:hypothetical protein